MKPSKNNLLILATLLLFLIIIPTVTNAASFSLIDPSKCHGNLCVPVGAKYCTLCDGLNVVKSGMGYLIDIGVAVAVLIITYGAILIMVGGAMPAKIQEGKKAITAAVVGVALMLMAWIIVNQVFFMFVTNSITGKPWNQIECPAEEQLDCILGGGAPITSGGTSTTASTTGRVSCDRVDVEAVKARLNGGGTVCNGEYSCPGQCDTSNWEKDINNASINYGVDKKLIRAIIAMESSCNPNARAQDLKSCGLMQVVGNCEENKNPAISIDLGTKKLRDALISADTLKQLYGNTVTKEELVYAIYNGGSGQSGTSVDCTPSSGFPTIPKWGCPINPGDPPYNACYIKGQACKFAACVK